MPVADAPDDDDVRETYNFAPGSHGLVYRDRKISVIPKMYTTWISRPLGSWIRRSNATSFSL